jgi:hypothetical protein
MISGVPTPLRELTFLLTVFKSKISQTRPKLVEPTLPGPLGLDAGPFREGPPCDFILHILLRDGDGPRWTLLFF